MDHPSTVRSLVSAFERFGFVTSSVGQAAVNEEAEQGGVAVFSHSKLVPPLPNTSVTLAQIDTSAFIDHGPHVCCVLTCSFLVARRLMHGYSRTDLTS